MKPLSIGLQRHSVNVIRDEAAMGARRVAKTLFQHSAQHGLDSMLVAAIVVSVALNEALNAHLTTGDVANGVDEV